MTVSPNEKFAEPHIMAKMIAIWKELCHTVIRENTIMYGEKIPV